MPLRWGSDPHLAGSSNSPYDVGCRAMEGSGRRCRRHQGACGSRSREKEPPPVMRYPSLRSCSGPSEACQGHRAGRGGCAGSFLSGVAFKPRRTTEQQLIECRSFRRQLMAKKADKAEPATVKNVVRTVTELYKFQLIRGRAGGS